jgi:hypothetical protein
MLICGIASDEQDGGSAENIFHAGRGVWFARQYARESWEICCSMMIDVVGVKNDPCNFL